MKKLITSVILLLLTVSLFGQEYRTVDANTLNIREYAGKNYAIIGKVKKGNKVFIISENNGWAEIETENGVKGFVKTEYLSNSKQYNNGSHQNQDNSNGSIWSAIFFIIALWIAFKIIGSGHKNKCNNCKKWFAMREIGKDLIDTLRSHVVKERTMKNSKGEVIRRWEESVPATVYKYHTYRKCTHCGYEDYLTSSKKTEN